MADAALLGADAPAVATERMKRNELQRELDMRRRVYPRFVAAGKMTEAQPQHRIWLLERILAEGFRPC